MAANTRLACRIAHEHSRRSRSKVITTFPPLSILYTAFSNLESQSVEFHEVHHNRRICNYGITQWIDYLMNSRYLRRREDNCETVER